MRVHRQIGGTGLQDGQQCDDQLVRTRYGERHEPLRPHSPVDQQPCQPVRPCVQLRVGDVPIRVDQRGVVGSTGHLCLEQLGQSRLRQLTRGVVPLLQHPVLLFGGQQLDAFDPLVRVGHRSLEEPYEALRDAFDRLAVEQIGAVTDQTVDAVGAAVREEALVELESQVELAGVDVDRLQNRRQSRQVENRLRVVLQGEKHLEQGVPGRGALRVEGFDQTLEGHVLVGVCREIRFAHTVEQLPEARVARRVRPQHQRVHEEPDELVQRLIGPARHRRTERNVRARPETGQQRGKSGLDHHEQARTALARQIRHPPVQPRVQAEGDRIAAAAQRRGPQAVGRQVELFGEARERLGPVGELAPHGAVLVVLAAQHVVLPQGEVRVPHRQGRPGRSLGCPSRRVRHGQVAGERGH